MRNVISIQRLLLLMHGILLIAVECKPELVFTCPRLQSGDKPLPVIPSTYSTNIKVNYLEQMQSVEMRKVVNLDEKKMAMELWFSDDRHVKYIKDKYKLLRIEYQSNGSPTCQVKFSFTLSDILEEKDSGPEKILSHLMEIFDEEHEQIFTPLTLTVDENMFVRKWESCFAHPRINVSLGFSVEDWHHPFSVEDPTNYIVSADAQMKNVFLTALFSNFNPNVPSDDEFQPPEKVYCEGYRKSVLPPTMPNYFSYDAEIIIYQSSEGIAPISSHRKVYYDFPAGILRTDSYDTLPPDFADAYEPVRAKGVSIIHDFNSGTMYSIDPRTGKCKVDTFTDLVGPSSIEMIGSSTMPNGDGYFSLNQEKLSYNGNFPTRGYRVDVYTGPIQNSNKRNFTYIWYFSTNSTQVVENEIVEKNVLLRMVIRPQAAFGKQGEIDVNFYNFVREEPSPLAFDLTGCYNESISKEFTLTFPANDALRGYEKLLKVYIHQAIKRVTDVSKQRIFITEVTFSGKYMYAEFKLLASPDVFGRSLKVKESTLDEAVEKLKKAVTSENFVVRVPAQNKRLVILKPEPNGLNEMAGDRSFKEGSSYKEGSVIALTIGMLFLGFVLGGVTLNLVVSRKYGVSLFQKQTDINYSQSLGESSM